MTHNRFQRLFPGVLLMLLLAPCLQISSAHASWGENFGSVHFNSGEPDFGTPPRRAVYPGEDSRPNGGYEGGGSSGPVYVELSADRHMERVANQARRRARFHAEWEAALARGQWRQARAQIAQEIQTLGVTGSLRDRIEVLDSILKMPTLTPVQARNLHTYFFGLRLSDDAPQRRDEATAAFQKLLGKPQMNLLCAHSLYQFASLYYQRGQGQKALPLYERVWREFPNSPKKPAALLMTARAGLLLPADQQGREAGKAALDRLRKEFPQNRYNRAVQGLYGRYRFLNGQYGNAADSYIKLNDVASLETIRPLLPASVRQRITPRLLAAYLYGMEQAKSYPEYIQAVGGVDREMQQLSPSGAKTFVKRLLCEPDLAAPYFYYRLYCTDSAFHYNEDGDSVEKIRERLAKSKSSLLNLAERIINHSASAALRLSPLVRVRLAEVYYQERRYSESLRWVQTVLGAGTSQTNFIGGRTAVADRALYVRGAIYQKQRRVRAATADFEGLLSRFPNSPLRPAAREELALLYETVGRNDAALDQYFALKYDQDVAYLLDVRMSTAEVAAYRASHPHHRQSNLITYSLGVRYLRDDNLSAARRTLSMLSRTQYTSQAAPLELWGGKYESESPDPLKVIDALVTLRQQIARARTREARARALYREASYHYKNGLLLFYNAALWDGRRIFDFDVYWNRHQMTPTDRAAIRQHMYSHEVYVRVIDQCRQIADRYPDTSAAPLALYRAACASERLASLNQWWQSEDNRRHFARQGSALLCQLAQRYPKHPLGHNARKYAHVFAGEDNAARDAWREAQKDRDGDSVARAF